MQAEQVVSAGMSVLLLSVCVCVCVCVEMAGSCCAYGLANTPHVCVQPHLAPQNLISLTGEAA